MSLYPGLNGGCLYTLREPRVVVETRRLVRVAGLIDSFGLKMKFVRFCIRRSESRMTVFIEREPKGKMF